MSIQDAVTDFYSAYLAFLIVQAPWQIAMAAWVFRTGDGRRLQGAFRATVVGAVVFPLLVILYYPLLWVCLLPSLRNFHVTSSAHEVLLYVFVILIPATGVGVANFFLACAFMGRATIGRWILAGTDPNSDFPDRLLLTRRIGIWAVLTISPAIILSFLYFAVGLGVV